MTVVCKDTVPFPVARSVYVVVLSGHIGMIPDAPVAIGFISPGDGEITCDEITTEVAFCELQLRFAHSPDTRLGGGGKFVSKVAVGAGGFTVTVTVWVAVPDPSATIVYVVVFIRLVMLRLVTPVTFWTVPSDDVINTEAAFATPHVSVTFPLYSTVDGVAVKADVKEGRTGVTGGSTTVGMGAWKLIVFVPFPFFIKKTPFWLCA